MIRIRLKHLLRLGALCVAGCSCVGLFSSVWWGADLFNHFRPQALLAGFLLLLSAVAVRDRASLWLTLFIVGLNGGLMAERLYAFPSSQREIQPDKSETISLLFSNVLRTNTAHQLLLDSVLANDPDLVVTTEVSDSWAHALLPLRSVYPHSILIPRPDNFGMAIYAKRPFKIQRYDVGGYRLPLLMLDFNSFIVMAAHPMPPMSARDTQELHVYMRQIVDVVRSVNKPLILVGDFNATLWSETLNELRGLHLVRANQVGWAWTWPSGFWPFAVQIDHIFVRDAMPLDFKTLPDIGSDHFPVRASVRVQTP